MADFSLEGVMKKAFQAMLGDVEIGLPGEVEAYDATAQTVKVRPAVGGLPALSDVPVLFPSGGGFGMTWPLKAGDGVWLTFSGRAFGAWLKGGGREPSRQRFALGEVCAMPQSPLAQMDADPAALILGEAGGAQIQIEGGKIKFGTPAADVLSVLDGLLELLQTATVATAIGPQPLDPAAQAQIVALRTTLGLIKG